MNITEANDTNVVLDALIRAGVYGSPIVQEKAVDAAARLADRANRALGAGLDAARFRDQLASRPAPVRQCRARSGTRDCIGDSQHGGRHTWSTEGVN